MNFIIYALACIAAHRIWNFEAVFQGPREWLLRYPGAKWLTCQVCNAFWVCLAVGIMAFGASTSAASSIFVQAMAAYSIVRAALWIYRIASHAEGSLKKTAAPIAVRYVGEPAKGAKPPVASLSLKDFTSKKCDSCDQKRSAVQAEMSRVSPYERRVVLLTTLSNFSPSYSVATCVLDQARMLAQNEKWLVQIWIHENSNINELPPDLPANVEVRQIVPQIPWQADTLVEEHMARLAGAVRSNLIRLGNATVITHDVMFVSSYASFAAAVHRIGNTPGFGWLHVCHSAVGSRPHQIAAVTSRTNIPKGHRLLCLNAAEVANMAAYYAVPPEEVLLCPNARDITAFGNFDRRASDLVKVFDLDKADVVQVYPVSATRMKDKGVGKIIDIMGELQRYNKLTCKLVLVTAHANGPAEKAALDAYHEQARDAGLPDDFLVVTSEVFPDTAANGLPQAVVRDLFSVSNVFIFPTISEASSLVLAEAALSGCLLVTNSSLHTVADSQIAAHSLQFPFGSLRSPGDGASCFDVAHAIAAQLQGSPANRSKRHALRRFNFEVTGDTLRNCVLETPFIALP